MAGGHDGRARSAGGGARRRPQGSPGEGRAPNQAGATTLPPLEVGVTITPSQLDDVLTGQPIALGVEVYNGRQVVDAFRVEVLRGIDDQPFVTDPPDLELFPDTSGTMTLTFTLPPGFLAGRQVIGVKVVSVTDPTVTAVEEVVLNVAPVSATALSVQPQTVTAGREAVFELALENLGNVPVDVALRAADLTGGLGFRLEQPRLSVPPGARSTCRVLATGPRPLFGSPVPHTLSFTAEGLPEPLLATATFLQKPRLPRGLLALLSILLVVLLWALVVLLGVNRAVDRVTEEKAVVVPGSIAGHVTDPVGDGGATVTLLELTTRGGAQAPGGVPPQVVADAGGAYRLEEVPTPATYQVVFAKEGFGTQSRLIDLELGQNLAHVDVVLVDGDASIRGLVSDGNGPLGGVEVTAFEGPQTIRTVTSSTGPVGSYVLERLPSPGTYVVEFAKKGYTRQTRVITLGPREGLEGLDVVLTKGRGSISGTVTDVAGLPVPDVTVTVATGPAPAVTTTSTTTTTTAPRAPALGLTNGHDETTVVATTKTLVEGAVGFYSLTGLPAPATFVVTFEKPGMVTTTQTVLLGDDGAETNLSPVLQPITGSIVGTVRAAGPPPCERADCLLTEVDVKIANNKGAEVGATKTASEPAARAGRYEIVGLAPGAYVVTFSKEGYQPQTFSISLKEMENRVQDVTLTRSAASVAGSAAGCSEVEIAAAGGGSVSAAVAPDGTFKADQAAAPGKARITFKKDGSAVGPPQEVEVPPGGTVVTGSCQGASAAAAAPTTTAPRGLILFPP